MLTQKGAECYCKTVDNSISHISYLKFQVASSTRDVALLWQYQLPICRMKLLGKARSWSSIVLWHLQADDPELEAIRQRRMAELMQNQVDNFNRSSVLAKHKSVNANVAHKNMPEIAKGKVCAVIVVFRHAFWVSRPMMLNHLPRLPAIWALWTCNRLELNHLDIGRWKWDDSWASTTTGTLSSTSPL